MPTASLRALAIHKWRILPVLLAIAALYFILRPAPDPVEVIRANLYEWAQRLEKPAQADDPASVAADASPAALSQAFGHTRRLVRDAFTADAVIQSRRGHTEQGREAIAKWCFSLRHQAESLAVQLSDIVIQVPPAALAPAAGTADTATRSGAPEGRDAPTADAIAYLTAHITAQHQGRSYQQSYRCELELTRDKHDKKWRISRLTAAPAPANSTADNTSAQSAEQNLPELP